ncbi:MAG: stage V sporulation protein AD [Bacillota bacterium]
MATKRIGKQTIRLQNSPSILATATVVGPKEGQGPLGEQFDLVEKDMLLGEKSWERAEQKMLSTACQMALSRAGLTPEQVDLMFAGDLLNQTITANFTARDLAIPFLGLYGACSTMAESLALGSLMIDGGFADHCLVGTSSHYASSERQFRMPVEYGGQRKPWAQWTVTGSGAAVVGPSGGSPQHVTHVTTGRIMDLGVKDPNDMGSAMAPAAADTLLHHFQETERDPSYYDLIVTGDLGLLGSELCRKLTHQSGVDLGSNYDDCGVMIFSPEQDTHSGGSGCGCSASVVYGPIWRRLHARELNKLLIVGTGALLSTISFQQGESIPCIAHAVAIENMIPSE